MIFGGIPYYLNYFQRGKRERGVRLSRYDIVQSHMIFGGIPYYLNYFQRGKSLAQIVDEMFFQKGAKLAMEYERLFSSVFTNPEMMMDIVKVLAARSKGFTRKELSEKAGYRLSELKAD